MNKTSSNVKISKQLYRSLLKLTTQFDKNPISKALIYRNTKSPPSDTNYHTDAIYYGAILDHYLGDRVFLTSFANTKPTGESEETFSNIVRKEFRSSKVNADLTEGERINTAFQFIRKLSNIWTYFSELSLAEPSKHLHSENQSLNEAIVEHTDVAFAGSLLIAHPLQDKPLGRTVILLLEHSHLGSYGLVISHPHDPDYTVQSRIKNLPTPLLELFGDHNINYGGKIRRLQALHTIPEIGGQEIPTCEIRTFASMDLNQLNYFQSHSDDLSKVRFFAGGCAWSEDQLAAEIRKGYWILAHSKPDKLINAATLSSLMETKLRVRLAKKLRRQQDRHEDAKAADATEDLTATAAVEDERLEPIEFNLWNKVMAKLGGSCVEVARLPPCSTYDVESIDY